MALKYKIGDRVRIKSIDWYNENKDKVGNILYKRDGSAYPVFFSKYMSNFCGEILTIKSVFNHSYHMNETSSCEFWTDEMIEGLVEEETKPGPKFKVGDKIKLKSTLLNDIFGVIGYEPEGYRITNISNGLTYFMSYSIEHYYELVEEETKIEPKFKVGDKVILNPYPCVVTDVNWRDSLHGFVYTVRGADFGKMVGEEDLIFDTSEEETYDFLKTDKPNLPSLNDFMDMLDNKIKLPEGYVFKDENGNPINTNMIVLEKKKNEYPKNYEECCEVLGCVAGYVWGGYKGDLIKTFHMLYICREAYWKLYGEEMGFDGPWSPTDSDYITGRYCIFVYRGSIICDTPAQDCILTFPTAEIRDAFYEAFRNEIEICKELL